MPPNPRSPPALGSLSLPCPVQPQGPVVWASILSPSMAHHIAPWCGVSRGQAGLGGRVRTTLHLADAPSFWKMGTCSSLLGCLGGGVRHTHRSRREGGVLTWNPPRSSPLAGASCAQAGGQPEGPLCLEGPGPGLRWPLLPGLHHVSERWSLKSPHLFSPEHRAPSLMVIPEEQEAVALGKHPLPQ